MKNVPAAAWGLRWEDALPVLSRHIQCLHGRNSPVPLLGRVHLSMIVQQECDLSHGLQVLAMALSQTTAFEEHNLCMKLLRNRNLCIKPEMLCSRRHLYRRRNLADLLSCHPIFFSALCALPVV